MLLCEPLNFFLAIRCKQSSLAEPWCKREHMGRRMPQIEKPTSEGGAGKASKFLHWTALFNEGVGLLESMRSFRSKLPQAH